MFAHHQSKLETTIRVLLTVVILINALVPTAALAKAANAVEPNATVVETSRNLPQQRPLFFDAPKFSYPDQTSPDPDEPEPPVPAKDPVEFSIIADPAIVPTNGLITFTVTIRNNSDQLLNDLIFVDALETGLDYFEDSSSTITYDPDNREIRLFLQGLAAGEGVSF